MPMANIKITLSLPPVPRPQLLHLLQLDMALTALTVPTSVSRKLRSHQPLHQLTMAIMEASDLQLDHVQHIDEHRQNTVLTAIIKITLSRHPRLRHLQHQPATGPTDHMGSTSAHPRLRLLQLQNQNLHLHQLDMEVSFPDYFAR